MATETTQMITCPACNGIEGHIYGISEGQIEHRLDIHDDGTAAWTGTSDVFWDTTRLIGFFCPCGAELPEEVQQHLAGQVREEIQPVSDLRSIQSDVGAWGDATFPGMSRLLATMGLVTHLESEVSELQVEASVYDPDEPTATVEHLAEETADIVILALRLAHVNGFDLATEIRDKMAVNRGRTWELADDGTIRHVEQQG